MLLFLAALVVAGPARAEPQPVPTAAVRYRTSNEAFDSGRFQEALAGFVDCAERADSAVLECRCAGMAGWASKALGKEDGAHAWFRRFALSCPPQPLPDGEDPEAWASMRASIDGELPLPAAEPPPVEPPPPQPEPEVTPDAPGPAPPEAAVDDQADEDDEPWCPSSLEIGGWVSVTTGIATAAAAMAVTILAQDASDRAWALHDISDELTLDGRRQHNDLIRDAQLRQTVALGLYVAAGALAITGITLLVLDRGGDEAAEAAEPETALWLTPAPGGAAAGVHTSF